MVVELNQKIDLLTAQVQFLTEQAQRAERERQERAELMHDLMPIANDAFRLATEQLEEVQEYVDLGDLLRLLKRLLRNGRNIEKMLDQLESLMDLAQTVGPLTDSAFEKATDLLQIAEQKGYFGFARGGMRIMDNVVTSFSEEDVRRLGDNVGPDPERGQGHDPARDHEPRAQHRLRRRGRGRQTGQYVAARAARPDARPERPPRPGADHAGAACHRRAGEVTRDSRRTDDGDMV